MPYVTYQSLRRTMRFLLLVLSLSVIPLAGCDKKLVWTKVRAKLEQAKLVEPPPPSPTQHDLLCDASQSSTCSKVTLEATLRELLRAAAHTPNSRLRVWSLGANVAATKVMGEVITPTITSRSRRAREAQLEQWQLSSRENLLRIMEPLFRATPARRSPLAESLTKIALAEGHGLARIIVAITDAREVATANFECSKRFPTREAWAATLHKGGILRPGLLAGMTVVLAYVNGDSSASCPITISKQVQLFDLWHYVLATAGAGWIMTSDLPSFYPELKVTVGKKEKK